MPDTPFGAPLPQESEEKGKIDLEALKHYPIRTLEYPMEGARVGDIFYAVPHLDRNDVVDLYDMEGRYITRVWADFAHPPLEEIVTFNIVAMQRDVLGIALGEKFYATPTSSDSAYSLYRLNGKYAGKLAQHYFKPLP